MPETVLVTGGGGFIGRALVRALGPGRKVLAPTRAELDLTEAEAVKAYLARHRVEAVIHAAVQPGHRNALDPSRQLERNCRMFYNLARALEPDQPMVFLGSGSAYDIRLPMEGIPESALDRSVPADEGGFSKYIAAKYIETRERFVELRLFGVFGPGEDPLIRFISNAICKALTGLPITCRQDRSFSYLWVEDLAPVVVDFLDKPRGHAAWNVVPDAPVALVELAHRVLALTGADVPVLVAQPGQGLPYAGSNHRLRTRMPGLAFTPMDEAIRKLIAYYQSILHELDRQALKVDR